MLLDKIAFVELFRVPTSLTHFLFNNLPINSGGIAIGMRLGEFPLPNYKPTVTRQRRVHTICTGCMPSPCVLPYSGLSPLSKILLIVFDAIRQPTYLWGFTIVLILRIYGVRVCICLYIV